ncbi:MAG: RecX family transcriptional regulator [Candidatus Parcubacteria bacterium]|nr:RecX family transcriptional regulator [Candidatus Parcubacteria bacterium]
MRITDIQEQKRKNRVNIYLDERFGFGVAKTILVDFDLYIGKELDQSEVDKIVVQDQANKALQKCFLLLGLRPRSEKELRDKLKAKQFNLKIIDQTIKKVEELGYLNDAEFARAFIEMKKSKGKIAIRLELRRKGVDEEIIKDGLEKYYPADEEMESALNLAQKKLRTYKKLPPFKIKQKLSQYLAGRGFSWDIIKDVLRQVLTDF